MTSRRQFLAATAAAAVAPILPAVPLPAAAPVVGWVAVTSAPPLVGWSVGTDGAMDWEAVFAPTPEEAVREWLSIKGQCDSCPRDTPGSTEVCECYPGIDYHRSHSFDAYVDAPTVPDTAKHDDGWCNIDCDRCGNTSDETMFCDVAETVGDEIVCHDCMTYSDWLIADPDHAAEMLDEMLEGEYGPVIYGEGA